MIRIFTYQFTNNPRVRSRVTKKRSNMKTNKSIQQVAAHFRATNDKAKSKVFQFSAKEVNAEILRQQSLANQRELNRVLSINIREQMQARIVHRLHNIAKRLPSTGYSMGDSKRVFFASLKAFHSTQSTYKGKWRGAESYGYVLVKLSLQELLRLKVVAGIITIIHQEVEHGIFSCMAFTSSGSKQHFSTKWEAMYLTKNYHAKTIQEAREWRRKMALQLLEQRYPERAKAEFERYYERAKLMFYGYEHSREAGNCHIGTMGFAADKKLNPKFGYRGDFLLSLGNGRTQYVDRMIRKRAAELQRRGA